VSAGIRAVGDLHEVHLLELPVPLWSKAQEQTDGLLREFALAADLGDANARERHLPSRLTALIEQLTQQFGGVSTEQERQLFAAADAGQAVIPDLTYLVPAEAAAASQILGDLLDEADSFCREGSHLLTLAADDDVVTFRWWYLREFIGQIGGAEPVPWPVYEAAHPTP
jgi:hypothetical protein